MKVGSKGGEWGVTMKVGSSSDQGGKFHENSKLTLTYLNTLI